MAQTPGATAAQPSYHHPLPQYGSPTPHSQASPYPQPRSSHNNRSPYGSPPLTNGTLPNNPYFAQPAYGAQSPPAFVPPYHNNNHSTLSPQHSSGVSNMAPPPPSTPGTMGPPPAKPVEDKPVDVNDLGDVLAGSGVDIREEEAYLMNRRTTDDTGLPAASLTTLNGTSETPVRGYSVYSQNLPGPRSEFYGAGTFNQPTVTEAQLQQEIEAKQRRLVRQRAAEISEHYKHPFIEGSHLRNVMRKAAEIRGLRVPTHTDPSNHYNPAISIAHQGHGVVVNAAGRPIGASNEIVSLVALACKERMRGVIEHSIQLARSRKQSANGVVPPELQDIATGQGIAEEVVVNGDAFPAIPRNKRPLEDAEDDAPQAKKQKTIRFPNVHQNKLGQIGDKESKVEEDRVKRRAARKAALIHQTIQSTTPSGAATPGPVNGDTTAPAQPKITKKAQKAAVAEKNFSVAEEQAATSSAVAKALGGGTGPSWLKGGGTGTRKKKDWLTSSQGGSTAFNSAPTSRAASTSQIPKVTTTAPAGQNALLKRNEIREDAASGRDLEIRDIVRALELDNKEKRTLAKAYNMQDLMKH